MSGSIPCGLSPAPPQEASTEEGAPAAAAAGGGAPGGSQDDETCSEASLISADEPLSPEETLAAAVSLKDEGNALFKEAKYQEALDKYKEGSRRLKKASGSEATAVYVQLSSNSCMCCLKLEKWQQAVQTANDVLSKEPQNQKALYRRAVARSNLGSLQQAKEDLLAVLSIDSSNIEARKELQRLKEKIQAAKAEDKKAYSGLFSRASGLYDDREAERQKKLREEAEEEAKKKAEWEKEMQSRREKGEGEEDFESWLEKTKEADEKKRQEKQKEQSKLESPTSGLKRRSGKHSSSSSSSSSSVMEVDEEDAAIINETKKMGYCYFRRNLTEEEKRLNAQNKPTKIDADQLSPQHAANADKDSENKNAEGKSISQWNSKGTTYEEKDVSPWARSRFQERLMEAEVTCGSQDSASPEALLGACLKASEALSKEGVKDEKAFKDVLNGCFHTKVETREVKDVSGEAHLAVVRGSRRVFFDMKCSMKLHIACSPKGAGGETEKFLKEGVGSFESSGSLSLPDVSSADGSGMSWLDGSKLSLDSQPSPLFKPLVDEAVKKYKEVVAAKIQAFLDDCKALP